MEWLWLNAPCKALDSQAAAAAISRQAQLTKPPGALGELENIAIRLAAQQHSECPALDKVHITVFAADHGVAAEGVSAFPPSVTTHMVLNFLNGGAAISVLAKGLGAHLEVVDVGVSQPISHPDLISQRAGNGTGNSTQQAAMTARQLRLALQAGFDAVERARAGGADLFIGGEMGIGNTTAATALYCNLLGLPPQETTGPGTGLEPAKLAHKTQVIQRIIDLHHPACHSPLEALRRMGGFEVAALTGAYMHAGQLGIPVLVDGFISTAAALVATAMQPNLRDWLFLSHTSAEPGHVYAIRELKLRPLLDLGMRLGEGSGAAVAVPLLRTACALHNHMATFAEAAVPGKL
jgi:nicotinate-nucleotide--dimethylbenzimidazole phosphoribosyltransferase